MEIALYQILTPILSITMIFRAISEFRRKEILIKNFILQMVFWISVTLVAVAPRIFTRTLEEITGFKSGVTGLLFLCMLVLGTILFYLLGENEKRGREISNLVRTLAIHDEEKQK